MNPPNYNNIEEANIDWEESKPLSIEFGRTINKKKKIYPKPLSSWKINYA